MNPGHHQQQLSPNADDESGRVMQRSSYPLQSGGDVGGAQQHGYPIQDINAMNQAQKSQMNPNQMNTMKWSGQYPQDSVGGNRASFYESSSHFNPYSANPHTTSGQPAMRSANASPPQEYIMTQQQKQQMLQRMQSGRIQQTQPTQSSLTDSSGRPMQIEGQSWNNMRFDAKLAGNQDGNSSGNNSASSGKMFMSNPQMRQQMEGMSPQTGPQAVVASSRQHGGEAWNFPSPWTQMGAPVSMTQHEMAKMAELNQQQQDIGQRQTTGFAGGDASGSNQEFQPPQLRMSNWQVSGRQSVSPTSIPRPNPSPPFSGWVRGASTSHPVEQLSADMMKRSQVPVEVAPQVHSSSYQTSATAQSPINPQSQPIQHMGPSRSPPLGQSFDAPSKTDATSQQNADGPQSPKSYPIGQLFVSAAKRLSPRENPLASLKNFTILYSSFWDWSIRAIDSVAFSLKEICFVVFVELWARLLAISLKKAAIFLKRFGDEHIINHHAEISEMKRVKSLPTLKDTPFVVRILKGERFCMKIDNITRKLLTARLTLENDSTLR